jgi:pimeloyl-ACP methyl ester carboxylesterase
MTTKPSSITRRSFCRKLAALTVLPLSAQCGSVAQRYPQRKTQTGILGLTGARLYYETHGSGPVMLMVPGAGGTADSFRRVTEHLAAHYTVVIYDRRGFSRSKLDGPQDYARRLEADADDVRRLIEHVSDEPAIVFGSSSGGLIALKVLTRHPSAVRTLVPHEPPAVRVLPDGQKWVDFFFGIYDLYCQFGIEPALKKFREQAFAESDRQAMARAPKNEYTLANATYWFEHELRQYPAVNLDPDSLKARADRIVLVAGRESRGYPTYAVNLELGKKLGRELIELPGGHIGFLTHPAEFAREFVQTLAQTGHGPKA